MMKSLSRKGFQEKIGGDHFYFTFYYKGKKTSVVTKFSRGSSYKEYHGRLFSEVKRQLKFEDSKDLIDFCICTFSEQQYIAHLLKQGHIKDENGNQPNNL